MADKNSYGNKGKPDDISNLDCDRGSGWQQLGADIDKGTSPTHPHWIDRAIDEQGRPVVVWAKKPVSDSSCQVLVSRFDSAWQRLGAAIDINPDASNAFAGSVAAGYGTVLVSFVVSGSPIGTGRYVAELSGSTWTLLGGTQLNERSISTAQSPITFAPNDDVIAAWLETAEGYTSGRRRVRVWRQHNNTREFIEPEQGGYASETSSASYASVAFGATLAYGLRRWWSASDKTKLSQ